MPSGQSSAPSSKLSLALGTLLGLVVRVEAVPDPLPAAEVQLADSDCLVELDCQLVQHDYLVQHDHLLDLTDSPPTMQQQEGSHVGHDNQLVWHKYHIKHDYLLDLTFLLETTAGRVSQMLGMKTSLFGIHAILNMTVCSI